MTPQLSAEQIQGLQKHDTCTISNAIETFEVRLRNEGFADSSIRCLTQCDKPLVGYAVTVRIRTANLPKDGHPYVERTDWWDCFKDLPSPRIVVIQDMDEHPGTGSCMGEVHGAILQALGCEGVITNGAVRDLPGLQHMGMHVFARSLAVSHCYFHMVDMGRPVIIGGLVINQGDLLHADMHGVLSVPGEIAKGVASVADVIVAREQRVLDLCREPGFSPEKLREAVKSVFN